MIPKLNKSPRSREYTKYSEIEREKVVKGWLFDGFTHRQLDKEVLHLDSDYTEGWQSMGILHYLGLKKEFRSLFEGKSIENAIAELIATGDPSYQDLIGILERIMQSEEIYEQDIESEITEDYEIKSEGKKTLYYTTRYERNPKNRQQAIAIHGTKCMACGFDFEEFYGERGKDYIEVHHIVPLASRDQQIDIDPKTDLVVVCSNCHRMIHRRKNDILTVEGLKKIINEK